MKTEEILRAIKNGTTKLVEGPTKPRKELLDEIYPEERTVCLNSIDDLIYLLKTIETDFPLGLSSWGGGEACVILPEELDVTPYYESIYYGPEGVQLTWTPTTLENANRLIDSKAKWPKEGYFEPYYEMM